MSVFLDVEITQKEARERLARNETVYGDCPHCGHAHALADLEDDGLALGGCRRPYWWKWWASEERVPFTPIKLFKKELM